MDSQTTYNYKVVRQFAIMTVVWGIVGMLVGVLIAAQLVWPAAQFRYALADLQPSAAAAHQRGDFRFRRFGAVRHLVLRRAAHLPDAPVVATAWRPSLSGAGNLVIVLAAITLPLGITTSKEYAELEWPIDILITVVWVAYAIVFFGTIMQAQGQAHLRRQLVLRRLHPHHRGAAHRQQRRRSRSA